MIPLDRQELDLLAGEYVLGVLDAAAAREIETALPGNAELRRAVAFWEEHLAGLSALAPAAEPPADLWQRIAARLKPQTTARPARLGVWRSATPWRWSTLAAAAVAACLALYIALAPFGHGPGYLAVLRAPQQTAPAFVAVVGPGRLSLRPIAAATPPSDRAFELWSIAPGGKAPRSLGVVPADGQMTLASLPIAFPDGTTLAISIEPPGGSPTGQPTGPIAFVGTLQPVE
jgi:anti-sigma-K factor RskA